MRDAPADLLELPVARLLDQLASRAPTPGAGAVAALTAGMAAGLVGMAASASAEWGEAAAAAAQAEALRRRLGPLAAVNAEAYEAALAALALPDELDPEVRSFEIVKALRRAADSPLTIAGAATDVALLAAEAAERCEPALRPDSAAAAVLAAGAARVCAHLVEVNLTTTANDQRVVTARALAELASDTARRLLDATVSEP